MSLPPVSELRIQREIGSLILHVILHVAPFKSYKQSVSTMLKQALVKSFPISGKAKASQNL